MENKQGHQFPNVSYPQKLEMERILIQQNEIRHRQNVLNHSSLCLDCPYPRRGFVCWSSGFECMRTRMMALDGRAEEVKVLCRINRINQMIRPFQIYDFRNDCYALAVRLSKLPLGMWSECQGAFNQFAEDHHEPIKKNGQFTHGLPCEWKLIFCTAFQRKKGFSLLTFDVMKDGFNCYATDLDEIEPLDISFIGICRNRSAFSALVRRALNLLPEYQAKQTEESL